MVEPELIDSLIESDKMQPLLSLGNMFGAHLTLISCSDVKCIEFLMGYAGFGNTISQYKELAGTFAAYVDAPSLAPADLQPAYEHLKSVGYRPFAHEHAVFGPFSSWSHQDVLDYFLLFVDAHDFDVEAFKTRVGGEEFIRGEAKQVVGPDIWSKFLARSDEKFWEKGDKYHSTITTHCLPPTVSRYMIRFQSIEGCRSIGTKLLDFDYEMTAAFNSEYYTTTLSEWEFTTTVRGLVTGKLFLLPNSNRPTGDKYEFFASYACLVQSPCSGKTRFLLEPIKQDDHARCMVIYFSCQPDHIIGVSDYSFRFLKQHVLGASSIADMSRRLLAMYCFIVRSISDADSQLKEEYCGVGSLKFDESFDLRACLAFIEGYDESMMDMDRPRIASLHRSSRPVYVVLALDEAQHMLAERILDSDDFRKAGPKARGAPPAKADYGFMIGDQRNSMKRTIADFIDSKDTRDTRVSLFILLRRALRWISAEMDIRVPVVLASADSKICDFFPIADKYPDDWEHPPPENALFSTLVHGTMVLKDTLDLWARDYVPLGICNWHRYFRSISYITRLAYFGRPFWGALMRAYGKDELSGFRAAIFAAHRRFPGLARHSAHTISEIELDTVSALGFTAHLCALRTSDLSASLVRSRMGLFQCYYPNQRSSVGLAAEPVLGILANHYLFERKMLFKALCVLNKLVFRGTIDLGENGKLVARIVLLSALQLAEPLVDYRGRDFGAVDSASRVAPRRLLSVLRMLGQFDDQLLAISDSLDSPQEQLAEYGPQFESEVKTKIAAIHDVVAQGQLGKAELEALHKYAGDIQSRLEDCGYRFSEADAGEMSEKRRKELLPFDSKLAIEKKLQVVCDLEAKLDPQSATAEERSFLDTVGQFLRGSICLVQWARDTSYDEQYFDEEYFDEDWLQKTAVRGAGLVMRRKYTEADFVIPVALENGELAALLIRAESERFDQNQETAEYMNLDSYSSCKAVSVLKIIINLREGPATVSIRPEGFLEVDGMDYAFLKHFSENVRDQLVDTLNLNRFGRDAGADYYSFPGISRAFHKEQ